ncbi:hypothetical protein Lesp02_51520 [Lentzea sp. NBRC 105346]|uniref:TadE family type IV pilus minor pilin n=1 Tax=Lentzea sp. NBRC 105346 TaxID=3032205 RepID=UPI0024A09F2A|nr:TadE family type IV pilus minor pilin [Lentzea sp. NBRC 105346]GLZ32964.1 hypothetical protein Lesp02_51520 [Lentzea sp. NBRC 105346]
MVTVEAAVVICVLLAVLALAAGGMSAMVGQLRCTDAAREAARLIARGDRGHAEAAARRIAPGATVTVHEDGDSVIVEVAATRHGFRLRAEAFAVLEPT